MDPNMYSINLLPDLLPKQCIMVMDSGLEFRIGETPEDRIERLAVKDVNRRQLHQQELRASRDRHRLEQKTDASENW